MANIAPDLPTKFPCWCRAIYSWGGETKKDLGFIEGDLIECLNAGDGSWWMGRLRRDRRTMGLFPSNFVQILDASYIPTSRAASPMPDHNTRGNISRSPSPAPQAKKSKTPRPFQSYGRAPSPNPVAKQGVDTRSRGPSPSPSRQNSYLKYQPHTPNTVFGTSTASRVASPVFFGRDHEFWMNQGSQQQQQPSPDVVTSSPAPPPPPPHRIAYNAPPPRATPSPSPSMNDRYPVFTSREPSPAPPSPGIHGHTPSPLRDAMEDVMSSLHHMTLRHDEASPTEEKPLDPWSPEAFEELRGKPRRKGTGRPTTSLGLGPCALDDYDDDSGYQSQEKSICQSRDAEPPYLADYVQRMEQRLKSRHETEAQQENQMGPPPIPPPKSRGYQTRPTSSMGRRGDIPERQISDRKLRNRKSAYELGRDMVSRTFTTKSTATNSSSGGQSIASDSTQQTAYSIMSGSSAGGISATSAGSLARRKGWGSIRSKRPQSVAGFQDGNSGRFTALGNTSRPETPLTSFSYHSSHASAQPSSAVPSEWMASNSESGGALGGFVTPKAKKGGFFKKLVESAKTGTASARSSIAVGHLEKPKSPVKNLFSAGQGSAISSTAQDMGLEGGGAIDWVQVRRDVNRSNSLSRNERLERVERCQMTDFPVIAPVDALFETIEGDEGADGHPVGHPTNFSQTANLQLVDKSARFVASLPPLTNATSLAHGYVCRPYRSDVQRLRAIFTWVGEKIAWEEDFEGEIDTRRVIQTRRGCAEEIAVLVMEMCIAVGLHAEVVRGYLKMPGELLELDASLRPNHWWNAVLADGEWRIMDACLASPTNPKRTLYSNASSQVAESWWFLARPSEVCYTHIPSHPEQQHIVPPVDPEVLLMLPCACPPYFRNGLRMTDYDTSLLSLEGLELAHVSFAVDPDIECVAEVEVRAFVRDQDGDVFESGDTVTKRALAQAEWKSGTKRYVVKALLPGDEGQGTLKVYAGKRGLMHSIKDNPHPLAFALPIVHAGMNPPYEFFTRHPTPHAMRHDLYVVQPQCKRLVVNNTFVFAVRQHPSTLSCTSPTMETSSSAGFARPSSAMSISSSQASGSYFQGQHHGSENGTTPSTPGQQKSAKLAIQAPSGKVLRLTRKNEVISGGGSSDADGGTWETIIKIGERGVWRGLVLADRSARWCVFGEWDCF